MIEYGLPLSSRSSIKLMFFKGYSFLFSPSAIISAIPLLCAASSSALVVMMDLFSVLRVA